MKTNDINLAQAPSLEDYKKQLLGKDCQWCRRSSYNQFDKTTELTFQRYLDDADIKIERYDHDGGYPVAGFKERQWLYVTCPGCNYQWSLRKLGIVSVHELININHGKDQKEKSLEEEG